jgi:hypothetical protein
MIRHVLGQQLTTADSFSVLQEKYPKLIAIDSAGDMTGEVADFCEYLTRTEGSHRLI